MNSFGTKSTLEVGGRSLTYYSLRAEGLKAFGVERLPYSIKVLLENLLRHEDGVKVTAEDIEALARWADAPSRHGEAAGDEAREIAFTPARVLMQDLTGVPAVVDLAAMRDAMVALGSEAKQINPLVPVELVIDHSVIVESFGLASSFDENVAIEYERNEERYTFLKWAQNSFQLFRVVPPGMGICHQVNLEHLGKVVFELEGVAYFDTLVGTDSHTTMINGLGVLGWGVGGIEAEAGMLGQPSSMLIPPVVGLRLVGETREGVTATDVVLTISELLRQHGVVGKFVEAFGPGVSSLSLETRATIGNMSPEYGATSTIVPDRPGDPRLPRLHGPQRRPARPRRGLREGARGLAPRARARADLLRVRRARPVERRAEPRGTEAAPGPRLALGRARRRFSRPSGASPSRCAASRRPSTCATGLSSSPRSPRAPTLRTRR